MRKISHALSQTFNIPVFVLWMVDRILSITSYRKSAATVVSRRVIGAHEYVELKLKLNKTFKHGFGDIYYFLTKVINKSTNILVSHYVPKHTLLLINYKDS